MIWLAWWRAQYPLSDVDDGHAGRARVQHRQQRGDPAKEAP